VPVAFGLTASWLEPRHGEDSKPPHASGGGWGTRQDTVNFLASIKVFIGLTIVGWAYMLWLARNEGCFLSAPRVRRASQ